MAAKLATGLITVAASAVVWLFTTFETSAQSVQRWEQHNQAITCRTVYQLQRDIRALTERLKFDASLTEDQRVWIQQQIANLWSEVRRLDPNGTC